MTRNRSNRYYQDVNIPPAPSAGALTGDVGRTVIAVERSGDWMPAEELRETALAALEEGKDVVLDLDRVGHLDASALQIMMALDAEQKKRGRSLQLAKVSPHLRQWLGFAGAADHFSMSEQKNDE